MTEKKPHLYYDATCSVCTGFASHIDSTVATISVDNAPSALDKATLLSSIHFIDTEGVTRTGADAVMTALSLKHRFLRPLLPLIRSSFVAPFAAWCYQAFSKRRHLFSQRLFWLQLVTCSGLLAGIALSFPAWFAVDRTYPEVPLIPLLQDVSFLAPWLSGILMLGLIGLLLYPHRHTICIPIVLGSSTALVLLDISRAQPWLLHYIGIFCLLLAFNQTKERTAAIIIAAQILIASIYFWSGIQKINTGFFLEVFPWVTEPLWSPFGTYSAAIAFSLGIITPFFESAFAIGLLTRRFRRVSIYGSAVMLLIIMTTLFVGHSWNSVIWPWNIAIFLSVVILFFKDEHSLLRPILDQTGRYLVIGAIALFFALPLGNWFGITPHYAAWSLYSGKVPTATLTAPLTVNQTLVPGYAHTELPFLTWSIGTLGIPPYPQPFVFTAIFQKICHTYPNQNLSLTIRTPHPFYTHQRELQTTVCEAKAH